MPALRQPVWRRAENHFFWNINLLSDAIADADRLLSSHGLPSYGATYASVAEESDLIKLISDLEGLIVPIVQGYVELAQISLNEVAFPQFLFHPRSKPSANTKIQRTIYRSRSSIDLSAECSISQSNSGRNQVDAPGQIEDDSTISFGSKFDSGTSKSESDTGYPQTAADGHTTFEEDDSELNAETVDSTSQSYSLSVTQRHTHPDPLSSDVTVILFSRRSRFRAGTRYRRRGIDDDGNVANYVETEQILQSHSTENPQTVAFLQIRGSVPLFWSQTSLKYRPPINLNEDGQRSQSACLKHWNKLLSSFDRVVIVNLLDCGRKRSEDPLFEAYIRHLLLLNQEKLTCILFDFHDYCRGLRFDNASTLLSGIVDLLRDMKFCWANSCGVLCEQRSVFRVNCLDCLDRTNLVQCLFASVVMVTQLKKLGLLGPEDNLPPALLRTLQRMWANNGDAISHQYAGTVAMKGDFTRTGERTMNGMVRDGVSSMNRYYLRFREITRQAAIDLLLGNDDSPELILIRNGAGLEAASIQAREENLRTLIRQCRRILLDPEETNLTECVLTAYSGLSLELNYANTLLLVTDRYLHFIRTDVSARSSRPIYVRIPVSGVQKLELGLEPSVFRAHRQVLRIFYSPPPTPLDSLGPSIVNPPQPSDISPGNSDSRAEVKTSQTKIRPQRPAAKSDSETLDSHMAADMMRQFSSDLELSDARPLCTDDLHLTSTAPSDTHPSENVHPTSIRRSSLKRRPPRGPLRLSRPGTTRQHFLAFVQPNVRLFNTLLIPVPPGDESLQALNVVAAMILVSVRSVGRELEVIDHPPQSKLTRLRQASIPSSYMPVIDADKLYAGLQPIGWRSRPPRITRGGRGAASPDATQGTEEFTISSDGEATTAGKRQTAAKSTKARVSNGVPPSRTVDKLKLRLNQIKLPDIRIKIPRRTSTLNQPSTTPTRGTSTSSGVDGMGSLVGHFLLDFATTVRDAGLQHTDTYNCPTQSLHTVADNELVSRESTAVPEEELAAVPDSGDLVESRLFPIGGDDDWGLESDVGAIGGVEEDDEEEDPLDDADDEEDDDKELRLMDRDGLLAACGLDRHSFATDIFQPTISSETCSTSKPLSEVPNRITVEELANTVTRTKANLKRHWSYTTAESRLLRQQLAATKITDPSRRRYSGAHVSTLTARSPSLDQLTSVRHRMSQSETDLDRSRDARDHSVERVDPTRSLFGPGGRDEMDHLTHQFDQTIRSMDGKPQPERTAFELGLIPSPTTHNIKHTERMRRKQLETVLRLQQLHHALCPGQSIKTSFIVF
ncbi:unnamed protein product [Dicrocoelium dendriticum]|nr:unnamed protein product [Dicrocoelium dendriticum]